ncbi:MAG: hypothetical protein EOO07_30530 [Chitinophagaceae bacterium]|nr:MAG: hypothetical protein EOO07_30530 [Chitinophagaceae bacterium]
MRKYQLLILLSIFAASANAQRKYSNEFLNIGVGSTAFGLSGSVIANVNDVTAGYWNPAGLARMETPRQVSFMHSEYFAGIAKYDYASFATAVQDNTAVIGASVIRFGVDDIPDTSELIDADGNINYDRVKKFSAADYAFIFSYARKKGKNGIGNTDGLSYGANVKVIHRLVGEYGKSWGFGLDAGVQYKKGKWILAAVGKDITSTFNSWSYNADKLSTVYAQTGNDIPKSSTETTNPRIILGAAYTTPINKNFNLMAETNVNLTTDGRRNVLISADPVSADPTMGVSVDFKKTIFLRGGVGNIQLTKDFEGRQIQTYQPNMGVGIKIKNFSLDYALTNVGNSSDALYSNVFSIRLDFEK